MDSDTEEENICNLRLRKRTIGRHCPYVNALIREPFRCLGPNPLLDTTVVEAVATFLDYKSLKMSRRVCSSWNTAIFPMFNSKTKVTRSIDSKKSHTTSYWDALNGRGFKSLSVTIDAEFIDNPPASFCDFMSQNGKRLDSITLKMSRAGKYKNPSVSVSMRILGLIFIHWCPNLKEFHLNINKDKEVMILEDDFFVNEQLEPPSADKMVNLTSLTFTGYPGHGVIEIFVPIAKKICSLIASLKTLEIERCDMLSDVESNIAVAESVRNTPAMRVLTNISNLKFLHTSANFSSTLCSSLKMIEFENLTTLELSFEDPLPVEVSIELMGVLGRDEFAHLEHLNIQTLIIPKNLIFPKLSQLKTLEVGFQEWTLPNLDFILGFPKLENLTLFFFGLRVRYCPIKPPSLYNLFGRRARFVHRNLRVLRLELVNGEVYNRVITSYFPNLEVLKVVNKCNENAARIESYLTPLSEHKPLKALHINVRPRGDLEKHIIGNIPNFQSLQKLDLFINGHMHLTTDMFERGFLRAPALRLIVLTENIVVPDEMQKKLVRLLSGSKLTVKSSYLRYIRSPCSGRYCHGLEYRNLFEKERTIPHSYFPHSHFFPPKPIRKRFKK